MSRGKRVRRQLPASRSPEAVVAEALRDEALMRQIEESLSEERRGEPATPFREILEEATHRRSM